MKDFKVSQFTKVLVMEAIKGAENPCAEAADQVQRVLMVALKDVEPRDVGWKKIIEDACQGGMMGLLLAKQDLTEGAIMILRASASAAFELNLDAARVREGALQGIADIQRFIGPDELTRIHKEIGKHFPTAGKIFPYFIRKAILDAIESAV